MTQRSKKLRNTQFTNFYSSTEVNKMIILKSPRNSGHVARMAAKKIFTEIDKEGRSDVTN